MTDQEQLAAQVFERVPAYAAYLNARGASIDGPFTSLPLTNKADYLLAHELSDLCWDGSLAGCHLIGASSGFSGSGAVFWPKRPQDEAAYLEAVEAALVANYTIDRKRTLVMVCLAFGTWIGGMQLAATMRTLAATGRHPLTVSTPGLNLGEAVDIYERFGAAYDQVLWISNVSSVNLVTAILDKRGLTPPPASFCFAVAGEYYPESFRAGLARQYGHGPDFPFVVWTGYGSADTGDLGVETAETIALRRFFHARPELSRQVFGSTDTPMLLAPSSKAFVEIIGGNIVATKDQLIPLVRYDTGDGGCLLTRDDLAAIEELPQDLAAGQPEQVLGVFGRASDAIVFYGTNLMLGEISDYLLSLGPEQHYGGFFELARKTIGGAEVFHFRVYIKGEQSPELAAAYQQAIIGFLQAQSLEFSAKYDSLCSSIGQDLITVELADAALKDAAIKHRYLVEE